MVLAFLAACGAAPGTRVGAFGRPVAPAMAYAEYVRGRVASEQGEHAEAVRYFRRAAALAPDDPGVRVVIAEELLADGDLTGAALEIDGLVRDFPDEPDVWIVRGRLAARRGDHGAAATAYERAITLGPDGPRAYLLAGAAHAKRGDHERARRAYERLLARWPDHAGAHERLGALDLDRKAYAQAAAHYERAVALDPDAVEPRVGLARTYQRLGRAADAARVMRDAFDRSGEDPWVGEQLFRALLAAGDRDGALALVTALDADFRAPDARVALGALYLELRRPDEALAVADAVLARAPQVHAARLLRARALAMKQDRPRAVAAAGDIPLEAPEWAEARALMSDLLARDGKLDDAVRLVDDALARRPDSVPLVVARAALDERRGDVPAARKRLDAAQARRPGDRDLVYQRAALEERAGDPERAVAIMQGEILASDPDDIMALNFVGYSYANRGVQLDEAERLLARALELAPDDGFLLDSWGWLLAQRGRLAEAQATLERADRLAPDEPEILMHPGEVHRRRGDAARARELWTHALALDPDDRLRARLEERVHELTAAPSGAPSR